MEDNRASDVVAAFGDLLDRELPQPEYLDLLSDLLVDTLTASGVRARRSRPGVITSVRTIAIPLASMNILLEIAGVAAPVTHSQVAAVGARVSAAVQPAVLSVSGFSAECFSGVAEVLLLDRRHLEAMLAGLVDPSGFLEALARLAALDAQPYTPLTQAITITTPTAPPPCAPADRAPPPWDLVEEVADEVRARPVIGGRPGWPEVSGMAVLDRDRLLLTSVDGLIEVHARRGTAQWFLPMRGLRGAAVVRSDGSVVVICHDAVIAYQDGEVVPLAGGLRHPICLSVDDQENVWVLSGSGVTYDPAANTLALTLVTDQLGRQQTYPIRFNASVQGMAWLQGRTFYLSAGSNSAIVDLAYRSSIVPADKITSHQSYPAQTVALNAWTVLSGSNESNGISATVYHTDLIARRSELFTRLRLNKIQGMAAADDGRIYILGDVRGNDVHHPWPVILKVTFPYQAPVVAPETPLPLQRVRLNARGEKRAYKLDPRPIGDGGQASVFGAVHRPTGVRVAFKRLKNKSPENVDRMRREIDAGLNFGDSPHVASILDFSPGTDWLVMPLADGTADEMAEELREPDRLLELVTAICAGLRQPHLDGWIHRDLKPANLLLIDGIWAVADWGLGRRPRGLTSQPGRTQVGVLYGTEGFAAPELSDDAHQAGPQADIYSIGQIIGWALRGEWPRANRPLLPSQEPWTGIVRAMTHDDPKQRPATVDAVLALLPAVGLPARPVTDQPHTTPTADSRAAGAEDTSAASDPTSQPTPAAKPMIAKTLLGWVEFDGRTVTIVKDGHGPQYKSRRAVPLDQIEKVVVKPATRLFHGYIQVIVHGLTTAPELTGLVYGGRPPTQDPLSNSIRYGNNHDIKRLQEAINAALARLQ